MADVPPEVSTSTLDYFLIEDGKSTGPHKAIEVWAKIQTGRITGKTPAWTTGLEEWKRLHKSNWKEHGIHIPEEAQADTRTEQQEGGRRQDKTEQEKEELTEAHSYHLVLELGLWEKLLNDISEKDSLEDLEDMKYLRSLKGKIDGLSRNLNKNGILKGSTHAYVSSEYDAFDKDAEEVEKKILKLAQETKSDGFLNSSSKEDGLCKLDNIKRGVHALCVDFRQRYAHRILGEDSLKIWELFAEKFDKWMDNWVHNYHSSHRWYGGM